ncbi:hypothetical protein [Shinella granuli]|uniref:hypothetical protein n=1 Tax=Shinella granuli TaxID=323621 RepID=UPI0010541C69|nr:hypothetical protein [Shinella granuli]
MRENALFFKTSGFPHNTECLDEKAESRFSYREERDSASSPAPFCLTAKRIAPDSPPTADGSASLHR